MLRVKALAVHGLAPVGFKLDRGDCLAVQGPSGSGKSLLLRALADLDEVSGEVSFENRKREDYEPHEWRRQIRYLSAESGWWLERAADHFVNLPEATKRGGELGLSTELFSKPVAQLSSGERQRLSFIRALEDNPPVLLLDEPTSALDEMAAQQMEAQILKQKEQGTIILIVTHSAEQADRLANRFLIIAQGEARIEVQ